MHAEGRFKVICVDCGKPARLESDASGCNDPDCCGGETEWIDAFCDYCKTTQRVRDDMNLDIS